MNEQSTPQEQPKESTAVLPTSEESQRQTEKIKKREPSQYETAMWIADQLGETEESARKYIRHIVWVLGRSQSRRLLKETLEVLAQGGMAMPDESRQRTSGEVFFHLAESRGKPKKGKVLSSSPTEQENREEQSGLPSHIAVAQKIAERLGETLEPQLLQIENIVWALGQVQAWALMLDAIEIDEGEGMLVPDGSRRRTVGGIFFYLAYTKGQPEPGKTLKRVYRKAKKPPKAGEQTGQTVRAPQPQAIPPFLWEDRIAVINAIGTAKGTATTVKITLVGQLGKFEDRGTCIVGVMQSGDKVPALPKGIPVPQPTKTNYIVYIGAKQWKNVAATASDPEDAFIIEGYPQLDTKTNAISVFATNITSKKLQAAKRQSQQQG
jgi:PHAX RNA-binding domain